ncbi:MAG: hypothetical protein JOZ05_07100 [Acetobacteraceae bacterium]|nr:hypothetical protein [Acetobacteraceae bacterium]
MSGLRDAADTLPDASRIRRLAAIVHADIVGYSRLVGEDDLETLRRLKRLRGALIEPLLRRFQGQLRNTAGDAFLLTFASVTNAVSFALELQNRTPEFDEGRATDQLIRFRVGVEIGDVIAADGDPAGEGINVAARLQAICPPGGICVSRAVYDHVRRKLALPFEPLGEIELKNIKHPVGAFVLRYKAGGLAAGEAPTPKRRQRRQAAWMGAILAAAAAGALLFGYQAWQRAPMLVSTRDMPAQTAAASLVVLPFSNLSGDPEQTYLADGISEDLTTDLSRLPGTTVIARESAFTYKGKAVDVRDVGRQLGVRYVLEGSIRKLGDVIRLNAQLVSADTGAHLWAERFDKPVRELQGGMDEVAAQIGTALGLGPAPARPRAAPTDSGAFDLVLRARSVLNEPRSDVRNAIARGLFEQALRLDPNSIPAKAGVVAMLARDARPPQLQRASQLLAETEAAAPDAPEVLTAKFLLERTLRHWEESVVTFRRLLAADPSAAGVAAESGRCPPCWGLPEQAIPLLERTAVLNPRSPNSAVIYAELGNMLLLAGRDGEAITWLEQAADPNGTGNPGRSELETAAFARLLLAAAYALEGRIDEAHAAAASGVAARSMMDFTVRAYARAVMVTANPELRRMYSRVIDGMRLAGIREQLDERADSHIPSDGRLRDLDQLNAPTPMTVPGGKTLLTEDLQTLIPDEHPLLLTTAAANPTIPGATLLPITFGGSLNGEWQARLASELNELTGGDRHKPIVTFAATINRWHARNLALRVIALGYDRVYWYRGGVEAWSSHGLPMAPVAPLAEFSQ